MAKNTSPDFIGFQDKLTNFILPTVEVSEVPKQFF